MAFSCVYVLAAGWFHSRKNAGKIDIQVKTFPKN
jgi:hypothetical protein